MKERVSAGWGLTEFMCLSGGFDRECTLTRWYLEARGEANWGNTDFYLLYLCINGERDMLVVSDLLLSASDTWWCGEIPRIRKTSFQRRLSNSLQLQIQTGCTLPNFNSNSTRNRRWSSRLFAHLSKPQVPFRWLFWSLLNGWQKIITPGGANLTPSNSCSDLQDQNSPLKQQVHEYPPVSPKYIKTKTLF